MATIRDGGKQFLEWLGQVELNIFIKWFKMVSKFKWRNRFLKIAELLYS